MTYYPNIIYHADTGFVFIDTLQKIGTSHNAQIVEYNSCIDGLKKTFSRTKGPRTTTLDGKVQNQDALRRKLNYLLGKQVYVMLGAENFATLAKLESYKLDKGISGYVPVSINIKCDADIEGQFYEAEDTVHVETTGTLTADTTCSGGYKIVLDGNGEDVYTKTTVITQSNYEIPIGNYTLFCRAKDTNQVTDDLFMGIYNNSDSTFAGSTTKTLTSLYALYTFDVTIASDDVGDALLLYFSKNTGTANSISIDFLGFVKT
ncbi:MAG TPA: hypothetical protein PLK94_07870 [Alphaproteobacteria bacterium]|nr:hypothetical protein [Alphaproteobacteria bacterium]